MMKKEKLKLNGEIVTFEKDKNNDYYFNGLKLEILDCSNRIEFSLSGIDESIYNNAKCIILPNWVTRIQSESIPKSLKECLEYVYAPGVDVIKEHTFEDCKTLKICATNKVQKICYRAFSGCSNLKYTPNLSNVIEMGSYAFAKCSNLTGHLTENGEMVENEILIPKSLTNLHVTFEDCTSIQKVVFEERDELTDNRQLYLTDTFSGCTKLSEIIGLLDGSKNDPLVIINGGVFSNTGFTEIVIPNNVNVTGCAFSDCKYLKSIEIHIAKVLGLCRNCPNLTDIILGDEVKTIGMSAFGYDSSLTTIDVNNVASIDAWAFRNSGITNVIRKNKNINISTENKEIEIHKYAFYQTPIQSKYEKMFSRISGLSL